MFWRTFFENDYDRGVLALVAGALVATYVRKRVARQVPRDTPRPWYYFGVVSIALFAYAVCMRDNRPDTWPRYFFFGMAGVFFIGTVWRFYKARQQFGLRTLLIVTFVVAVLCSAAQYIPIAPLLLFLAIPAAEWARSRSPTEASVKVRDVLKRLAADGWYQHHVRGSHRVLKHAAKPGIVVVAGDLGKDVAPGTLKSIWKQAGLEDLP